MTARLLAAAAVCTAAPWLMLAPTAHAASATVVGEASCLYGGPAWMSSWSVTSDFPFSVYGGGLERTHQFDEDAATLEVLVNVGSSNQPAFEVIVTTIARPDGCDGIILPPEPVVEIEPAAETVTDSDPIVSDPAVPDPIVVADPVVESASPAANDDEDIDGDRRKGKRDKSEAREAQHRRVETRNGDRRDRTPDGEDRRSSRWQYRLYSRD